MADPEASRNSTNVRRTLTLGLSLWGSAVVVAAASGVFEKLSTPVIAALAAFAAGFAIATSFVDAEVRDHLDRVGTRALGHWAFAMDLAVVATAAWIAASEGEALLLAARFPFALSVLYLAPIALALHAVQLSRLARAGFRSPAARSPGARPAAL